MKKELENERSVVGYLISAFQKEYVSELDSPTFDFDLILQDIKIYTRILVGCFRRVYGRVFMQDGREVYAAIGRHLLTGDL